MSSKSVNMAGYVTKVPVLALGRVMGKKSWMELVAIDID